MLVAAEWPAAMAISITWMGSLIPPASKMLSWYSVTFTVVIAKPSVELARQPFIIQVAIASATMSAIRLFAEELIGPFAEAPIKLTVGEPTTLSVMPTITLPLAVPFCPLPAWLSSPIPIELSFELLSRLATELF